MYKNRIPFWKRISLSFVAFIFIFVLFLYGVSSVGATTLDKQEESLRSALQKNVLHCYAIEGYYPPSLDYMKEHYGLQYNEDLFFVDYQPIGSNILPNITIIRKDA